MFLPMEFKPFNHKEKSILLPLWAKAIWLKHPLIISSFGSGELECQVHSKTVSLVLMTIFPNRGKAFFVTGSLSTCLLISKQLSFMETVWEKREHLSIQIIIKFSRRVMRRSLQSILFQLTMATTNGYRIASKCLWN